MTTPRIVNAAELRAAIGFEDLITPMSEAFRQSSAGRARNGMVVMVPGDDPGDGDILVKTGVVRGHSTCIVKVAPWFAVNPREGRCQGGFLAVLDSRTGQTCAILNDEHYLSDIRTAAAGALAARLLAPATIGTAAVLGAGVQAYWQSLALHHERRFDRLYVWARDRSKAEALRQRIAAPLRGVRIEIAATVRAAVDAADALITATLAREPLVSGGWLRAGQFVVAVGADDPTKCELDAAALLGARVFVDSRETAAANGDVHRALSAGHALGNLVTGELGDVVAGTIPGRTSDADIIIAKLVGIGAQDLIAAEVALSKLGIAPGVA